jgi:Endonuclease NucS C-terminal domain
MTIYLCSVSGRFPENYEIGLCARVWGVEDKYQQRITAVRPGDRLIFLVGGEYRSIHTVESEPYVDDNPLWPEKDGDHFPHRIKISPPNAVGHVSASTLASQISFMRGKVWGGTIQGPNGVFNDRLTSADLGIIQSHMSGAPAMPPLPSPAVVSRSAERQGALFKFYEADVEHRILDSLSLLGLRLYVDSTTGRQGRQFVIDHGRIDLLCEDLRDGALTVVELKKGQAPDQALLQLLRYMSWVRQHVANGRDVKGIILTESADSALFQVVGEVPNVSIRYYKVTINVLP